MCQHTAVLAAISILISAGSVQGLTVLYVDDDASGADDGSSWCDAYIFLQDALAAAMASGGTVAEIRVAQGTYKPDQGASQVPGDREATFQLLNGVALKGGYEGCGASNPGFRDVSTFRAELSGDLDGDDGPDFVNNDENSYHVLTGSGSDETAILDGLRITGGNADGPWEENQNEGGGMYNDAGDPTVTDCIFTRNSARNGGGMANSTYSSPTVISCTFDQNSATTGGGMYSSGSTNPTLVNCTFSKNCADSGGGMANGSGSPTVTNCTFSGNSAEYGGGMSNGTSSPTLTNCVFHDNFGGSGGAMYNYHSHYTTVTNCTFARNVSWYSGGGVDNNYSRILVTNCIFWGNLSGGETVEYDQIDMYGDTYSVVAHSCIQGLDTLTGNGNIALAPLFTNPDADLRLLPGSPCIDAGDNQAVAADISDLDGDGDTTEPVPLDHDGIARFLDDSCTEDTGQSDPASPELGIVDMGAYEYPVLPTGDADGDGVTNCLDDCPVHPDPDQADCDDDGIGDVCALDYRLSRDCNINAIPDDCDIASGVSADDDGNGIPDVCQGVVFVDAHASAGGDGTSWGRALNDLQDALAAASSTHTVGEIRVAQGTYKPDRGASQMPGDPFSTFELINGVAIKGGYAGLGAPEPDARDFMAYETILSGNLNAEPPSDCCIMHGSPGCDDPDCVDAVCSVAPACCTSWLSWSAYCVSEAVDLCGGLCDNVNTSLHVVSAIGTHSTASIEGFTITGGNASTSSGIGELGGGMCIVAGTPTIRNCTFRDNFSFGRGGGLYAAGSSPTLIRCKFRKNFSGDLGGGMFSYNSTPTLMNCEFSGNTAKYGGGGMSNSESDAIVGNSLFEANSALMDRCGGAMYNWYSSPVITNCVFRGNSGLDGGGVVNHYYSSPFLVNCVFSGNDRWAIFTRSHSHATLHNCTFTGNNLAINGDSTTLANCILWNNEGSQITGSPVITYSCVDGGWPGEGNIDLGPRFVDVDGPDDIPGTEDDDLRLQARSPCIDAGDNMAVPLDTLDLDADGDTAERTPLDLGGNLRFTDDCLTDDNGVSDPPDYVRVVDMGAYEYQPNDVDDDGDVDLRDLADFLACFSGEGGDGIAPECEHFDADCDGDLDLNDLASFGLSVPRT